MRVVFLLILVLPTQVPAGWVKVGSFDRIISSGYFFNESVGFIGSGAFGVAINTSVKIWRTDNGGATWKQCQVPSVADGRVTSICMINSLVGYASITDQAFTNNRGQAIWKTTDGGNIWTDHTQGHYAQANCVYATPYALVFTAWTRSGGLPGGYSVDDGSNVNRVFNTGTQDEYNGIDFTDDLNGIVSTGPVAFGTTNPCFFTTNGGRSWSQGGNIPESWGIYGVKNTGLFLILSEGRQSTPARTVRYSTDVGRSWNTRFTFSNGEQFTGHIAGKANAVYVQTSEFTRQGLFRSDDFGRTWKNVGGPSNERDTRFAVTGCAGEVVYAFDENGGVWKTTDGGDGTLQPKGIGTSIPDIEAAKAGDTVRIPIYISEASAPFSITDYDLRMNFNTDLLEAIGIDTIGTLTRNIGVLNFVPENNGVSCTVTFARPITEGVDLSLPLVVILARVYLTTEASTSITVDSFHVSGTYTTSLQGCTERASSFTIRYVCGDSVLSAFMKTGMMSIANIRPNPNASGSIELEVASPQDMEVSLEAINTFGVVVKRFASLPVKSGTGALHISIEDIVSGVYYFRLTTSYGTTLSHPVAILR